MFIYHVLELWIGLHCINICWRTFGHSEIITVSVNALLAGISMPILMILRHALKISSAIIYALWWLILFPLHKRNTYVNMSLNHSSCIDCILVSAVNDV